MTTHDLSHAERALRDAPEAGRLDRADAEWLATRLGDASIRAAVMAAAAESKRIACGDVVTVSRNVFVPLTNLCRDRCSYCTFAKQPDSAEAKTYTLDEVAELISGGDRTGCIEALFCLGDKPEIAYRAYKEWLTGEGFRSTAEYLVEGCKVGVAGGLLPHTNAGILTVPEMEALKPVNASMGLMLESTSPKLRGKGQAHQYAPDKDPKVRLRMHEEAGELKIPFTTGMLIGIGEDEADRVDTLYAIRDLDDRFDHIQEAIIQPFHPKPGTRMRWAAALPDSEVAGWIALSRLVLGHRIQLQAPPNLAPGLLEELLHAGVGDWGGVSPVTLDFINPEAPWPTLRDLRDRTEAAGQRLVERLPVYPRHLGRPEFFAGDMLERTQTFVDDRGYALPRGGLEAA